MKNKFYKLFLANLILVLAMSVGHASDSEDSDLISNNTSSTSFIKELVEKKNFEELIEFIDEDNVNFSFDATCKETLSECIFSKWEFMFCDLDLKGTKEEIRTLKTEINCVKKLIENSEIIPFNKRHVYNDIALKYVLTINDPEFLGSFLMKSDDSLKNYYKKNRTLYEAVMFLRDSQTKLLEKLIAFHKYDIHAPINKNSDRTILQNVVPSYKFNLIRTLLTKEVVDGKKAFANPDARKTLLCLANSYKNTYRKEDKEKLSKLIDECTIYYKVNKYLDQRTISEQKVSNPKSETATNNNNN